MRWLERWPCASGGLILFLGFGQVNAHSAASVHCECGLESNTAVALCWAGLRHVSSTAYTPSCRYSQDRVALDASSPLLWFCDI